MPALSLVQLQCIAQNLVDAARSVTHLCREVPRAGFNGERQRVRAPDLPPTEGLSPDPSCFFLANDRFLGD